MRLELRRYKVVNALFGSETKLENGTLYVNKEELVSLLNESGFFERVEVYIAKPGENTRIVNIMDAVQPRWKTDGSSPFPGALGPMRIAGRGETNALDGISILQLGKRGGIQEGFIDMSGPGAEYSFFSGLINIALNFVPFSGVDDHAFDSYTRAALLKASVYLGRTTRDLDPDETEIFSIQSGSPGLPRVAYIYQLQSQELYRDTLVYGRPVRSIMPILLHPNEILDGAIVSSNYIIASQKNPTYFHLNNPVVRELSRRHGRDLIFAGVIAVNEHSTLLEKERSAAFAAKLALQLDVRGVVITQEGGGHADTDLMLNCSECEKMGIKTVIIANESSGPQGDLPPLVDVAPEADAVVSTGNNDELVKLGVMDKVFGCSDNAQDEERWRNMSESFLARIYTSTNQLGWNNLTTLQF